MPKLRIHTRRRLSDEAIEIIRTQFIPGDLEFGEAALARRFGVDRRTLRAVRMGKTYKCRKTDGERFTRDTARHTTVPTNDATSNEGV